MLEKAKQRAEEARKKLEETAGERKALAAAREERQRLKVEEKRQAAEAAERARRGRRAQEARGRGSQAGGRSQEARGSRFAGALLAEQKAAAMRDMPPAKTGRRRGASPSAALCAARFLYAPRMRSPPLPVGLYRAAWRSHALLQVEISLLVASVTPKYVAKSSPAAIFCFHPCATCFRSLRTGRALLPRN